MDSAIETFNIIAGLVISVAIASVFYSFLRRVLIELEMAEYLSMTGDIALISSPLAVFLVFMIIRKVVSLSD